MRSYAIGDIHGHLDLLRAAHARIADDMARTGDHEAPIVHVGDLVDRGPDSRGVIAHLMAGPANWHVIRGNHDSMFAHFMADPHSHDPGLRTDLHWLHPRLGGAATLASYGVRDAEARDTADAHAEALAKVPETHGPWLAARPLYLRFGEALFVHAGLRPGVPLAAQTPTDLMWIRAPFHSHTGDFGALVVHGHTPVDVPMHYGNRVNLDTGAAYGGPLSAVVIEGRAVWLLTDDGRVPLRP